MLLMCVNGSFYIAGLNEGSRVWVHAGASSGGPGAIPLSSGDELRLGKHHIEVESIGASEVDDTAGNASEDLSEDDLAGPSNSSSSEDEESSPSIAARLLRRSIAVVTSASPVLKKALRSVWASRASAQRRKI
jgi:predicted component of type VI protein secretion system